MLHKLSPSLDPLDQMKYIEPNQSIIFSFLWRGRIERAFEGLKELAESPELKHGFSGQAVCSIALLDETQRTLHWRFWVTQRPKWCASFTLFAYNVTTPI